MNSNSWIAALNPVPVPVFQVDLPADAAEFLLMTGMSNRTLDEKWAAEIAKDMDTGDYDPWANNNPIMINGATGQLIGGQHTCKAVTMTKAKKARVVIRKVPAQSAKKAHELQDTNKTRGTWAMAQMSGEMPKHGNINKQTISSLTNVIRAFDGMQSGNDTPKMGLGGSYKNKLRQGTALYDTLHAHGEAVDAINTILDKGSKFARRGPVLAAFGVAFGRMDGDKWIDCMRQSNDISGLVKGSGMYHLHNMIDRLESGHNRTIQWEIFVKSLYCLQAEDVGTTFPNLVIKKSAIDYWKGKTESSIIKNYVLGKIGFVPAPLPPPAVLTPLPDALQALLSL